MIELALALLALCITTILYVRLMWTAVSDTIEEYGRMLEKQDQKTLIQN